MNNFIENQKIKSYFSNEFSFIFNKETGRTLMWSGPKFEEPIYSPIGPLIADIEITTKCNGINGKVCPFCYKSNTPNGKNMTYETFVKILDNMPNSLTQIAFGVGSELKPDTWKIFKECRNRDIVPNVTVANIDDETVDKIVKYCGACAVSRYDNKDICYDSVKKLTDRGMKQVNIHQMISEENFQQTLQTLNDIKHDKRLEKLNAIVFLSLKKKGRGTNFNILSFDKFKYIVAYCLIHNIPFGFDSCTATKFKQAIIDLFSEEKYKKEFEQYVEPCESFGLFSSYINVEGEYFPCSFIEGSCDDWKFGIDMTKKGLDFLDEVWYSYKVRKWRDISLIKNRKCPVFEI